ncbi:ribosome-inactivating family protein [Pseudomonas sp. SZMC_28357]|uniref:ribosome-inactivating family protein n=1 Tax=Pseudomonas sp. SZMC_28357 TaxID=3074380 RepID=UPI0028727DB5|nr:ribosome-inactivating family protein [Pseudomonas sp. SZMC_28357]MDR9751380.1 ribosome-inactivating family protein [Pseudomonas sp. SZMC_28357]
MIVKIQLTSQKWAYSDSIAQLRSVLAIGGRSGFLRLDLVLETGGPIEASLLMSRKTLYIDGFLARNGTWYYFSDSFPDAPHRPVAPGLIEGKVQSLKMLGTHPEMGTHKEDTRFDSSTPFALRDLSSFTGGNDLHLHKTLSFAAVACAEAARFKDVEHTVARLLSGGVKEYKPMEDWRNLFTKWEDYTAAGSAKVWVKHIPTEAPAIVGSQAKGWKIKTGKKAGGSRVG